VYLRLILFLGLVAHKLVWEVLKRGQGVPRAKKQTDKKPLAGILKLCKIIVLSFLLVQTLFLKVFPIIENPRRLRIAGVIIYFVGLITAVAGRVQLGKNWVDLEDYQVLQEQSLVTNGIFRYVRHPIYTGDLLLILGLELALNSWLVLGVIPLLAVIVRQVWAEEALLSRVFSDYEAYRKRSKRFIPFIV
jgi:protein-S-isoprenylcysteine O-methyltransferase Ste14